MTQDLLVATRGGIGDHIISNGLINHLCSEIYNFRKINLVCYKHWEESLRYLYEDNPLVIIHPGTQVELLGSTHERRLEEWAARDGFKYYSIATRDVSMTHYQEFFYKNCGHPFEYRYAKFKLPNRELYNEALIEKFKPKVPYTFVFNNDKFTNGIVRGWKKEVLNPDLAVVTLEPKFTKNLFEWLPIIYDAEEIHCIPGGPFHLIDSVLDKCKAKKFVYHDARRETCFDPNNKFNNHCWEIVKYETKHAL